MRPNDARRLVGQSDSPETAGTVGAVPLPDHQHVWEFEGWHGSRWVRACRCGACEPATPPPAQRRFGVGLVKQIVRAFFGGR